MLQLDNSTSLAVVRTDMNLNVIEMYREIAGWLKGLNISAIDYAKINELENSFKLATLVPG
jgi:hypothetical protein